MRALLSANSKTLNVRLFTAFARDRHVDANWQEAAQSAGSKGHGKGPASPNYANDAASRQPEPPTTSPLFHPNKSAFIRGSRLFCCFFSTIRDCLQRHLEDMAEIEFVSAEARGVRDALLDLAGRARGSTRRTRQPRAVEARGLAAILTKARSHGRPCGALVSQSRGR